MKPGPLFNTRQMTTDPKELKQLDELGELIFPEESPVESPDLETKDPAYSAAPVTPALRHRAARRAPRPDRYPADR